MIVIDTSAIVAALTGEAEGARVNTVIAGAANCLMSAATYLEGGIVLTARYGDDGAQNERMRPPKRGLRKKTLLKHQEALTKATQPPK